MSLWSLQVQRYTFIFDLFFKVFYYYHKSCNMRLMSVKYLFKFSQHYTRTITKKKRYSAYSISWWIRFSLTLQVQSIWDLNFRLRSSCFLPWQRIYSFLKIYNLSAGTKTYRCDLDSRPWKRWHIKRGLNQMKDGTIQNN